MGDQEPWSVTSGGEAGATLAARHGFAAHRRRPALCGWRSSLRLDLGRWPIWEETPTWPLPKTLGRQEGAADDGRNGRTGRLQRGRALPFRPLARCVEAKQAASIGGNLPLWIPLPRPHHRARRTVVFFRTRNAVARRAYPMESIARPVGLDGLSEEERRALLSDAGPTRSTGAAR